MKALIIFYLLLSPLFLYAQEPNPQIAPQQSDIYPVPQRHTIQNKFFSLDKAIITGFSIVSHQRDDYYDSLGLALSLSYFWNEQNGISFKWMNYWTDLGSEAEPLRKNYGFTPDAAPQHHWLLLGWERSLGYGKILFNGSQILQFDQLISINTGIATADQRIIPTVLLTFSPTFYLKNLFKIRFDFGFDLQIENRTRGYVLSSGFVPGITIAWGGNIPSMTSVIQEIINPKGKN